LHFAQRDLYQEQAKEQKRSWEKLARQDREREQNSLNQIHDQIATDGSQTNTTIMPEYDAFI